MGNPASTKYTEAEKVGAGLNFERKSNQLDLFEANLVKSFEISLVVERPSAGPGRPEPAKPALTEPRWRADRSTSEISKLFTKSPHQAKAKRATSSEESEQS